MADIHFRRTGISNPNGSIPGELTIGRHTWPTIERGEEYTFVRLGTYQVAMDYKNSSGRRGEPSASGTSSSAPNAMYALRCLRFTDPAIQTHLIHDALYDDHRNLSGCIAPGLSADYSGVYRSGEAMNEIFDALGGFQVGKVFTISVANNIRGNETRDQWISRRL
jgi:hypothetical protein